MCEDVFLSTSLGPSRTHPCAKPYTYHDSVCARRAGSEVAQLKSQLQASELRLIEERQAGEILFTLNEQQARELSDLRGIIKVTQAPVPVPAALSAAPSIHSPAPLQTAQQSTSPMPKAKELSSPVPTVQSPPSPALTGQSTSSAAHTSQPTSNPATTAHASSSGPASRPSPQPRLDQVTLTYMTHTWNTVHMHHKADGKAWSQIPGLAMEKVRDKSFEVRFAGCKRLEFVLTDGRGGWDKPSSGQNYLIEGAGSYSLEHGKITRSS